MIYHKDKDADYLYQQGDSTALPIVEVPTTCGTGSEVTPISVLTIHAKRTKSSIPHRIFPQYALVDGKYLASAPKKILVNTSVDSLGHLIESHINLGASPFSRMISEYGMALWKDVKPALLSDHVTDEDRDRMMLTSTLAGMAIIPCRHNPATWFKLFSHLRDAYSTWTGCGIFPAGLCSRCRS